MSHKLQRVNFKLSNWQMQASGIIPDTNQNVRDRTILHLKALIHYSCWTWYSMKMYMWSSLPGRKKKKKSNFVKKATKFTELMCLFFSGERVCPAWREPNDVLKRKWVTFWDARWKLHIKIRTVVNYTSIGRVQSGTRAELEWPVLPQCPVRQQKSGMTQRIRSVTE